MVAYFFSATYLQPKLYDETPPSWTVNLWEALIYQHKMGKRDKTTPSWKVEISDFET